MLDDQPGDITGGTVIADFACGLFDQHGKGRRRGVLDDLFGVAHDGSLRQRDSFVISTSRPTSFPLASVTGFPPTSVPTVH